MKAALTIFSFIVYSIVIFWVNNIALLSILLALQCLTIILTHYFKLGRWLGVLTFLGFVAICNLLYSDFEATLLIILRLSLSLTAAIIISRWFTTREFSRGLVMLLYPLKIFKVDLGELEVSIMVALNMLPVLRQEAIAIQDSLKLKGCSWSHLLRSPTVIVVAYFNSLLDRVEVVKQSLRLRGY